MQQGCSRMALYALLCSLLILFSPSSAVRLTVSPRPCFLPEQWKLIGSAPAAPVAGSRLKRLDRKAQQQSARSSGSTSATQRLMLGLNSWFSILQLFCSSTPMTLSYFNFFRKVFSLSLAPFFFLALSLWIYADGSANSFFMPFIFRTTKVVNYEVVLRWSANSGIVDGLTKLGTVMGEG